MLTQTSSTEKAKVQAKGEAKIKNVESSLNLDLDLSLPRSLRIRTFHEQTRNQLTMPPEPTNEPEHREPRGTTPGATTRCVSPG